MKLITADEIRPIQLQIMDELDAFCRAHEIPYTLLGGTLIGAIRHKGYIPWDDDIDICLFRPDYDRLLREFQSESGYVELWTSDRTPNYLHPYCKAVDTRTVLIEADKKHAIGVNVDVFPLDDMPESIEECRAHVKRIKRVQNLLVLKYLHLRKGRSPLKNAFVVLSRLPLMLVPNRPLLRMLTNLMTKYSPNPGSKYVANLCGAWGEREIFLRADFQNPVDGSFEGRLYRIPDRYDHVLRGVYGDYMQLPPESERVSHHAFVAYWK